MAGVDEDRGTGSAEQPGQDQPVAELRSPSGDVEIPSEEWASFVESFSRQHEGWVVSISVAHGIEKPVEVGKGHLQRVSIDQAAEKDRIQVSLIRSGGDHLDYAVSNPSHLTFKRDASGGHEGIDIISADGAFTSVRFRVAALPETLDGVLLDMDRGAKQVSPGLQMLREDQNE